MNKPKYEIGDRIPDSPFTVRGIAPQDSDYLYFVQVDNSGNCFVGKQEDIDEAIALVNDKNN